ncbi:WXG100 family type VII secretion target [Mycobacterium intracellulare]|uniref:WXG100 family type VII secretion target n=1 Tax=Mycobacterium intracellulare TaxID=1767 RepID=UPI001EEEF196|nr:WXG100 family type VII secretion target [Mycobacterium intracellulare]MEE3751450.1 WXG100 family type VII secretion target [Mycobacterium intracellulare]
MAGELTMRLEAMASAAQILTNQADDLHAELESITRDWSDLSSTWRGVAASAFQPPWDEWHQGATAVARLLSEHSQLLLRSLDLMLDHETVAAKAFAALAVKDPTL